MSEYVPDFIERGEARCEAWEAENVRGDVATCQCGKEFNLRDAQTISPDPYAIPVCPDCFDFWFANHGGSHE